MSTKKFDLEEWAFDRAQERAYHDETDLKDTLIEGFQKAKELYEQQLAEVKREYFEAGKAKRAIYKKYHWEEAYERGYRCLEGDEREFIELFDRDETLADYEQSKAQPTEVKDG